MRVSTRLASETGSVLVAVLAILAALLVIFISVFTFAINRYSFHRRQVSRTTARYLAQAGVQRAVVETELPTSLGQGNTSRTPNGGTVRTQTTAWGPFLLIRSTGAYQNQTVHSTALLGSEPPELLKAAVTVCDDRYPLTLAGNCRVYGDINTGPLGVQSGRIRGQGLPLDRALVGRSISHDSIPSPALDKSVLRWYLDEREKRRRSVAHREHGSMILDEDEANRLLDLGTIYISNDLVLKDVRLRSPDSIISLFVGGAVEIAGDSQISGLIEISSERIITIKDSARVDLALLQARDSITIRNKSRFSGVAQCDGLIAVRDSATLSYPAMLLHLADRSGSDAGAADIVLASSSMSEGTCYMASADDNSSGETAVIRLDTNSVFSGYLVSKSIVEIRGELQGAVLTELFHAHEPPTTYVNWLVGGRIIRRGLAHTPALPIFEQNDMTTSYQIIREDIGQ